MKLAGESLKEIIQKKVEELGFEAVQIEFLRGPQPKLKIDIDFLKPAMDLKIGIEDCVKVSREVESLLDGMLEAVDAVFPNTYDLEVSSAGLFRPLRKREDFLRFKGYQIKIHLFQALSEEQVASLPLPPKQLQSLTKKKDFIGRIGEVEEDRFCLEWLGEEKRKKRNAEKSDALVWLFFSKISKANLEPPLNFEFGSGRKEKNEPN